MPMMTEQRLRMVKLIIIAPISPMVTSRLLLVTPSSASSLISCSTALKRRMETASLTTPSPKRMEFKVGNDFSLTMVSAATVSVAHIIEARRRHSLVER